MHPNIVEAVGRQIAEDRRAAAARARRHPVQDRPADRSPRARARSPRRRLRLAFERLSR